MAKDKVKHCRHCGIRVWWIRSIYHLDDGVPHICIDGNGFNHHPSSCIAAQRHKGQKLIGTAKTGE